MQNGSPNFSHRKVHDLVKRIVSPEHNFVKIGIAYGIAISLLTLAVPVAVQTLINTVVNTASVNAVITLAGLLFVTLALSGLFAALRTYVMERYERHIYARLTSEMSLRLLMAQNNYFEGRRNIDITNRYFDITTFQKNIPTLVIDGFTLCLQIVVGFTLVSFYHPVFLAFCVTMALLLACVWIFWGRHAMQTAVQLSHKKYNTAKWLGDIAAANRFFKSTQKINYAAKRTDTVNHEYIQAHRAHFNFTFKQTVALLFLYALASSTLLGLGGVLVISGQLSIGQLVAAELVLTAIFLGFSQASSYLKMYFELCGAADEIDQIFNVPIEQVDSESNTDFGDDCSLEFHHVDACNQKDLHFYLPAKSKCFCYTRDPKKQDTLVRLLRSSHQPEQGWIKLGGHDLRDYPVYDLRQAVVVIDRSLIVECSIKYFMKLSAPDASTSDIESALKLVGLDKSIDRLEAGLDTNLSLLGAPLLAHEFLLLKLAAAILSKPKLVVLSEYFDNVPETELKALLHRLEALPFSIIYLSNQPEQPVFDYCLLLDSTPLREGEDK